VTTIDEVLDFWFSEQTRPRWWDKDEGFDAEVTRRFEAVHKDAAAGKLAEWERTPEGALALIVSLDQFPRNMYRGTPRAFATDDKARAAATAAIDRGHDLAFDDADHRMFFYLPLEHSERIEDQDRCVTLVRERCGDGDYPKYAEAHRDVIRRFGRFPHRNAILGRRNTPEEEAYLSEPGAGF
jgi:uncharacterized protein (DUF924 family)